MSPTKKARFRRRFLGIRPWRRHSLVLMVAGLVFMGIGVSYILTESTPSRDRALHYALVWFPMSVWGCVFILAGSLAFVSARWPPVTETWGYMVLTGLSAGWSATYAAGVIFGSSPVATLSSTLVWGLIAFMWWSISGLVNPGSPLVVTDGQS